jgi:3-deoxy-7-phosphoheptulonate synthase
VRFMNNIVFQKKLSTPEEIRELYPLSEKDKEQKKKNDEEIQSIFTEDSHKFLLIIGPCSADRVDAVLDYMHRLKKVADDISDVITICPRIYTNKPRTTGVGYKGMLHQPDPSGKPDMEKGLIAIRHMHMRCLEETGFSCADEMLYPENHYYLEDLLSYVAVGARSVEDQMHRLTASSLNVPVGMKNPTSGDLSVMLNAIIAANTEQTFIYRGYEIDSKGNPLAHSILRGYVDKDGRNHPNYHYEDLMDLLSLYEEKGLKNPSIIVDCNHSNSDKRYLEQIRIAQEVLHSRRMNPQIRRAVKGLMIESYLVDGNQKVGGGVYGQSITDPCLGWEKTEKLLYELADILRCN